MQLHTIPSHKGRSQNKKRIARGISGKGGKTGGRGGDGQKSRQGSRKFTAGFEGGQVPLFRRMPKLRGFNNPNRVEFQPVNLSELEEAFRDADKVGLKELRDKNLIAKLTQPVKILGDGELKKKLSLKVHAASKSAITKIEKAGGKIELLPKKQPTPKKPWEERKAEQEAKRKKPAKKVEAKK